MESIDLNVTSNQKRINEAFLLILIHFLLLGINKKNNLY